MSAYKQKEDGGKILKIALLKLKNAVIDRSKILVFVFVATIIFAGIWTCGAYAEAAYKDRQVVISSYTQYGSYNYTAPVTESNPLYTTDTVLEMGKPAYFFAVSPTVDLSFIYRLEATDSANISVKREIMIVATSKKVTEEEEKKEEIFWQKEFPLKSEEAINIENREPILNNFSVNVSEIRSMVRGVQDQLEYSEDATINIVTRIKYHGKINGENVSGAKDFSIPIILSDSYYQIPEGVEFNERIDKHKMLRVQNESSLLSVKLPLSLFLFSIVLLGMLIPCTKMRKVEPEYIEQLEKESKNSPFKEFISKGKLPEDRNTLIKVEISSLKELVDSAVDMNERVICDAEVGTYFVIHSGVLYIFFNT